ncbi:MAG: hypothetical protein MPK06_07330 [Alphaproteobacteria bacterium]|nr:hypothetical protein [Alphaproteobacteria bacterium]MDA8004404.1 hypothetical protein [Alphaproteobacteria bacterium]MDA8006327.1 hypothetical protein [Alphaproteobacteria bacterium]MDA8012770.1 hypothetical protein [Alphaproteobacteria bacterium]
MLWAAAIILRARSICAKNWRTGWTVHFSLPFRVEEAAPKINLTLRVGSRRADGLHEVASLTTTVCGVGDRVIAEERREESRRARKRRETATVTAADILTLSGPFASALSGEDLSDNLVLRARSLFLDEVSGGGEVSAEALGVVRGLRFVVEKNLPVGSGFGGGSGDAAACLRILRDVLGVEGVMRVASRAGSDVSVCMRAGTFWVTGVGAEVRVVPRLPRGYVLLAWPLRSLATREVYSAFEMSGVAGEGGAFTAPPRGGFSDLGELCEWCRGEGNDLTFTASRMAPEVDELLRRMSGLGGVRMAGMSGSGSGCFGVFGSHAEAERGRGVLRNVWATIGTLP